MRIKYSITIECDSRGKLTYWGQSWPDLTEKEAEEYGRLRQSVCRMLSEKNVKPGTLFEKPIEDGKG